MSEFQALVQRCAPAVHPMTMAAVMRVESTFNPFAIGVVGGRLERQPANKSEAVATAKALEAAGYNFSLGVAQVNRYNLPKYGLDYESACEPCANLRAASLILKDCYDRAKTKGLSDQDALQAAFSCYYSGNFSTGFRPDFIGQPSYVQKVLDSAGATGPARQVLPIRAIPTPNTKTAARTQANGVFRVTSETPANEPPPMAAYRLTSDAVMVYR
jgi:type IV secretion system protein VirB1